MDRTPSALRLVALTGVVASGLLLPRPAPADDTDLFSTTVPPNVLLVTDNSGSMEHIVWHPAFDPDDSTGWCSSGSIPSTDFISSDETQTHCGETRTLYHDSNLSTTRWDGDYLRWYFGLDDSDPGDAQILSEIAAQDNGTLSACLGGGTFDKYRRSRATALQQVLREVICNVNQAGSVRFGTAQFRDASWWDSDPEGGFVRVPVDDWSSAQDSALEAAIDDLAPETWTPLGETLFQVYTYFMSRDSNDVPLGADGNTPFPVYRYDTNLGSSGGGDITNTPPPSPVQYSCQKNFVIVITDGEPTKDDFDTDTNPGTDDGFANFLDLIGDYEADGEVEEPGCCSERAMYLDDIAKFMQQNDFRPDLDGEQKIDVYTVGFTTTPFADDLLRRTADLGNGLFRSSNNAEELASALIAAITDIVEKSQSFTAATIPVSRLDDGNSFYATYFVPKLNNPLWEGHLKAFDFTESGEVLTPDGKCATGDDPTADPPCAAGTLRVHEDAFWDAATSMPDPGARRLYYEDGGTSVLSVPPAFSIPSGSEDAFAGVLGITTADAADEPYASLSPNAPGDMAVALVDVLRGCEWGSDPCVPRVDPNTGDERYLGDIFHSNPVIVGSPTQPINEAAYQAFAQDNRERTNVIYAGANDGFLHAFVAGHWDNSLQPPRHNRGVTSPLPTNGGQELFGFMPAPVRDRIKDLPKENSGLRQSVYVDGSPVVVDVWMYREYASGSLTTTTDPLLPTATLPKNALQWRTVLIGGLRDGGEGYYALDVTDPPATVSASPGSYPLYLWGFPCDDCGNAINGSTSTEAPWVARTWSKPVVTRVRVAPDSGTNPGGYERWVAIFGGGYHEEGDPNSSGYVSASLKGRAIYMVDITTGEVLAKKTFDPIASALDGSGEQVGVREMQYAFASSPAVFDLDFDGFADVIYIGDLGGNLWKWVVSSVGEDPIHNSPRLQTADLAQPNWPFRRVFRAGTSLEPTLPPEQRDPAEAYDNTVHYQSFFTPPAGVIRQGKLILAFGSGERADPIGPDSMWADGDATNNNHYYVVRDDDPFERIGSAPHPIDDSIEEADLLTQQDLATQVASLSTINTQSCSQLHGSSSGYFLSGRDAEKFITATVIEQGGRVTTGSYLPPDPNSSNPCEAAGSAFAYEFHLECGVGFDSEGDPDPSEPVYRAIGEGMPADPRYSTSSGGGGGGGGPGGGCPNKLLTMTSGGYMDSAGSDECIHGIEIRGWRQR